MTNKEAIKRIQDIITYNGLSIPTSLHDIEALELAIQALEFTDENFPKTFIDYINGERI